MENQIVITPDNIDNVVFENVTTDKKCSVSFETPYDADGNKRPKEWRNEHDGYDEETKIVFNFDGSALSDVLDDACARLVIKAQSRIREIAGTPEQMAEYLEKHERELEYNYAELQGRRKLSPMEQAKRTAAKLSPEEKQLLLQQLMAQDDA